MREHRLNYGQGPQTIRTVAVSDLAASAEYRKNLVAVYAKRAIERAAGRAKG